MPRFAFTLEAVLTQRTHVERQRQRELALVQSRMQQLQAELQDLDQTARQATEDLRAHHLVGPVNMQFITAHRRFVLGIQRRAMGIAQEMARVQKQIDTARAALAEAAKQRKAIEKLREKQYARWLADMSAKENAELDEIGMQMSYREARSSSFSLSAQPEGPTPN